MSTDTFYVRVGKIEDRKVTLHCLTGFGGGLKDYDTSRSFALLALLDAKRRARDAEYLAKGAPPEVAKKRLALARKIDKAPSSLHSELSHPNIYDDASHAEHTPRFISRTRLLKRYNAVNESKLQKARNELSPLEEKGKGKFLEAAWERLHHFDLAVEVTDAKYLDHLVEGHFFGTTAFTVWDESRPLPPKPKAKKPKFVAAPKSDFSGAKLTPEFWPDLVLASYDLSGSKFQRADFTATYLKSDVKAVNCDFTEVRFTSRQKPQNHPPQFKDWNLRGSVFRGASLAYAEFRECNLSGCDFTDADLRHARFLSGSLKGAIFKGANLEHALIQPSIAKKANLDGAKNYTPAPGGKAGSACAALSRMMFEAKSIDFEVHFVSPNAEEHRVRLTLMSGDGGGGRTHYFLTLWTLREGRRETFTARSSQQVLKGTFGTGLRMLSDESVVPEDRTLDVTTLEVKSRGAPLKGPALKEAVRAALAELLVVR